MSTDHANRDYRRVVQSLPRPSIAQTARFAEYVAGAHSWYKHLPLYPKKPFYFFLDPNAGKRIIYDKNGAVRLEEETDDAGFHYTHQTTKSYIRNFGLWNYRANYGSTFYLPSGDGDVLSSENNIGLNILDLNGNKLPVSNEFLDQGTAYLSAFVHSETNISIWTRFRQIPMNESFLATLKHAPSMLSKKLGFIWAVMNTKNWYSPADKNLIIDKDALQSVFNNQRRYHHIDEEALYKQAVAQGDVKLFPILLQAAQIEQTLLSRGEDILRERESDIRQKLAEKWLCKEDREALLKIWQQNLSELEIKKSLETLLNVWEQRVETNLYSQDEYKFFNQDERKLLRDLLVKQSLAYSLQDLARNEKQTNELNDIWLQRVYGFSDFVKKHYPFNSAEKNLLNHLVSERIQQLEAMKIAMNNFLDAVY